MASGGGAGMMGGMGNLVPMNMMSSMSAPSQGQRPGQMAGAYMGTTMGGGSMGSNINLPVSGNLSGYPMPPSGPQVSRMMGMQLPMGQALGMGGMMGGSFSSPMSGSPLQQTSPQQAAALQMQQLQQIQLAQSQVVQAQAQAQTHAVCRQIEYYFSQTNLARDTYLKSKMDPDGYVLLSEIAQFNRIKALTTQHPTLLAAVRLSTVLDVLGTDEHCKIRARRRRTSPSPGEQAIQELPLEGVLDRAEARSAGSPVNEQVALPP